MEKLQFENNRLRDLISSLKEENMKSIQERDCLTFALQIASREAMNERPAPSSPSSSAVYRFDDDCYTEGFFVHLLRWAASPAFERQSLPEMQYPCPVDVARVCLLSWAR